MCEYLHMHEGTHHQSNVFKYVKFPYSSNLLPSGHYKLDMVVGGFNFRDIAPVLCHMLYQAVRLESNKPTTDIRIRRDGTAVKEHLLLLEDLSSVSSTYIRQLTTVRLGPQLQGT